MLALSITHTLALSGARADDSELLKLANEISELEQQKKIYEGQLSTLQSQNLKGGSDDQRIEIGKQQIRELELQIAQKNARFNRLSKKAERKKSKIGDKRETIAEIEAGLKFREDELQRLVDKYALKPKTNPSSSDKNPVVVKDPGKNPGKDPGKNPTETGPDQTKPGPYSGEVILPPEFSPEDQQRAAELRQQISEMKSRKKSLESNVERKKASVLNITGEDIDRKPVTRATLDTPIAIDQKLLKNIKSPEELAENLTLKFKPACWKDVEIGSVIPGIFPVGKTELSEAQVAQLKSSVESKLKGVKIRRLEVFASASSIPSKMNQTFAERRAAESLREFSAGLAVDHSLIKPPGYTEKKTAEVHGPEWNPSYRALKGKKIEEKDYDEAVQELIAYEKAHPTFKAPYDLSDPAKAKEELRAQFEKKDKFALKFEPYQNAVIKIYAGSFDDTLEGCKTSAAISDNKGNKEVPSGTPAAGTGTGTSAPANTSGVIVEEAPHQ